MCSRAGSLILIDFLNYVEKEFFGEPVSDETELSSFSIFDLSFGSRF
jgi:hypothetical protein